MEATGFFSPTATAAATTTATSTLLHRPKSIFSPLPQHGKNPHIMAMATSSSSNSGGSRRSSNSNKGRDFGGRLVDENMIVLRMRIQETKLLEASNEPPAHWMEWEQKYYQDYIQDVLEAMGLLQNYLMHVRPSFALGLMALITVTLLISYGVALFKAVHIAQMILSGFHLS